MLSSSGSSTNNNLQRTKSATSVKDRRKHPLQAEPIDPHTARAHALIAAHRAVDRSRASTSTDLERSESVISRKSAVSPQNHNASFSPATHLRRQRSTLQVRVPKLAESLQVPGVQMNRGRTFQQCDYVTEFGLRDESYGAEPSSYRKLRRSKSLLTPTRKIHRPLSRTPETSLSQAPTLRTNASSTTPQSPGLKIRLKRSLNFIRQSPRTNDRIFTAPPQLPVKSSHNSEAIELARNQYYQDLTSKEASKKPSLLFRSKTNQEEKTFRKSLRANDLADSRVSQSLDNLQKRMQAIDRKSSAISLSNKIKKLFAKSKQSDILPPQQLEASRPHFDIDLSTPSPEAGFDSYLDTEPQHTTRYNLYIPSVGQEATRDTLAQVSRRLSQSNSCDSLSSKSKSRVTSWSNSITTTSSTTAQPSAYEVKRLSVIKEDGGPHQPSSSAGRHIGGVPLFRQPLNLPRGSTIDSQRIYSALIKRIDEEQKEVEKTQEALKEIHQAQDQDQIVGHYLFSAPTIRRVQSRESTSLAKIEENQPLFHSRTSSAIESLNTPSTDQTHRVLGRRTVGDEQSPAQSSFHSLARRDKSTHPYPFWRPLEDKKVQTNPGTSSGIFDEQNSITQKADSTNLRFSCNRRFDQSTNSVYSRTTNGGINIDYISPTGSTEDFGGQVNGDARMDTVLSSAKSKASSLEQLSSRTGPRWGASTPSKGAWKLWMDRPPGSLEQKTTMSKSTHIREHAQIDPDDTDVRGSSHRFSTGKARPDLVPFKHYDNKVTSVSDSETRSFESSAVLKGSRSSTVELKEVPRNYTPTPKKDSILRRSQSALLSQTGVTQLPGTDNGRPRGRRQISPKSITKISEIGKNRPVLSDRVNLRKENTPVDNSDSPPVSTPGRYQLQRQSENSTCRTRKGKSAVGLAREHNESWLGTSGDSSGDSPSDKLKSVLSARLSKPFDMDIPDRNRPFDSTYLGKPEAGNGNRLSVAPSGNILRRPKTYGDLGQPPYPKKKPPCDTNHGGPDAVALPAHHSVHDAFRSVSGLSFSSAGKRMISNFLKGRRKLEDSEAGLIVAQSPAFI